MAAAPPSSTGTFVIAEDPMRKLLATVILCVGCLAVWLTLPDTGAEIETYKFGAWAMLPVILTAFAIEASGGVRALNRVDIVSIFGLYFLTFAEFLHPHVKVLYQQATGEAVHSCRLVLVGTACLAIGRHFPMPFSLGVGRTRLPELPPKQMFQLFVLLFVAAFLWIFMSVNFNPLEVAHYMLSERFARPWQRGRIGGWTSFLTELNLLTYPMAALAGYIFGNAKRFGVAQKLVVAGFTMFALMFFIADGTRNRVLIFACLFVSAYFISNRGAQNTRIIITATSALAVLWTISGFMLDFRNKGLGRYLAEGADNLDNGTFMIDNNLVSIARVSQVFPSLYPYPGWDIVVQVFTKWIPRALWPDKPIDWATSIENALGTGGTYTIAVTYVGEAYLIAGYPTLILISLFLGALGATWTKVGLAARTNLELIYYATGFFAAMLGMRSIQFISVAIVPLVAFYVVGRFLATRYPQRLALG